MPSPAVAEHLTVRPLGWVTDPPLPRPALLRARGNGVVPHQAASLLLGDLATLTAAEQTDYRRDANTARVVEPLIPAQS